MSKAGTPRARRSRTPSVEVERELLAAALVILVRDGLGGLTVRAVAAEAGIAPMGLYSRLGGKDGLVDALLMKEEVDAERVDLGQEAYEVLEASTKPID